MRQAIAVHVGALGMGMSTPKTAQQVSVMFYENATTTYGDVGGFFVRGSHAARLLIFWPNRTSLSWEACLNLATGTRPTRCVATRLYADLFWSLMLRHARADTPRSGQLSYLGRNGVPASKYCVPVQVHSQIV